MKSVLPFFCALGCLGQAFAQEPLVQSSDLPRIAPTPPGKAVSTFQVREGFRIEQAASDHLVSDPITIAFDEDSRLYVIEMRDYSERRQEVLGRVRLLEDTNDDGKFDRSTVFAEDLAWPTAIFPWDGGIFVGATPDLFYLKDADGDGKADIRKLIFTGFGNQTSRLNVQQLFNSLNWALDNRIHGANGGNSGLITQRDGTTLNLGSYDFSFDPHTFELRLESGGGQYGLSFDSHGHKFVCSNSSHIRQVMYEARYISSDLSYSLPPAAADIPLDGGAAEVFRLSADEPWRVMRTRWRVAGMVGGPIEGGGRPSGYFTGATGITIYKGDAYGPNFLNNAFTGDAGGNLVHRKKLIGTGLPYQAVRADDEQRNEFAASTDNWFRPVHFANAPDGALYIVDMYREVIEHPWSLPPNIKKHLDLNSGNDMGRIYRVVPHGYKQPKLPKLSKAKTEDLVSLLDHPNGWHRETAARLIYQRQDQKVVEQVRSLARISRNELGRMHALYVLSGLKALNLEDLKHGLSDSSPHVRRHAVRLSETLLPGKPDQLLSLLKPSAADSNSEVRFQLAFTLTKWPAPQIAPLLAQMFQARPEGWELHALLLSASRDPVGVLSHLNKDAANSLCRSLAEMVGTRNLVQEVKSLLTFADEFPPGNQLILLAGLQAGLVKRGSSLENPDYKLPTAPLYKRAAELLQERRSPEEVKTAALQLLSSSPDFPGIATVLLEGNSQIDPVILRPLFHQLASKSSAEARDIILAHWGQIPEADRPTILQTLMGRNGNWNALLDALFKGNIPRSQFTITQVESLRKATNNQVRSQAIEIFGPGTSSSRKEVVEKLLDAARMKGDAARGHSILQQRCLICHQLKGEGQTLGPALETVTAAGRQTLLVNILDPNREVSPRYAAYEVTTREGENYSGILAGETASSVTLQLPGGNKMEYRRDEITSLQPSGKSLMPEQLEEGLTHQELADLLEAIIGAK